MKLLENSMLLVFLTSIVPVGLSVAAQPGTVVGWGELVTPYAITNAVAVSIKNGAAGGPNALALLDNGTVARWGNIQFGLATLPADLTNVIGVAAGALHSVVLRSDGTVVCWGRNLFGESSPPAGLSNVVAVSAGFAHSLALLADGTLRGWGDVGIPAGLSNVIAIASGVDNNLVLKGDGAVAGWGGVNQFGQNNVPTNLTGVVAIAAGKMQGLALKSDGTVVAWGNLGLGSPPNNLSNVTAIAAGFYQNLAILSDHSLVAWGNFDVNHVLDIPTQLTNYTAIAASSDVNVALTLQPVIFAEPSGFALPAGEDGTMSVDAVGSTPLQYQWRQNGQNLFGATNSTLTITNLQAANVGDYYALISNWGGSVTSSVASITVNPSAPTILMNPGSQTVLVGSNTSFQVSAKGSEPLFFQWWFNGNIIPGATNATFNLSNVTKSDGGQYYAVASNAYNATPSAPAQLTVHVPAMIATQPTNQTVVAGSVASFQVMADGTLPLFYQWQVSENNIAGATNSTLTISNAQANSEGSYRVLVTNAYGSDKSQVATLEVDPSAPIIITQPPNKVVLAGATVRFTVVVSGSEPFRYQWQLNGLEIFGATNATLTLRNVQTNDIGSYRVVVSNFLDTKTSNPASLDLFQPKPGQIDWPQPVFSPFATGFSFPTCITHARDGSGRIFVGEQTGRISIVKDGALLSLPFLNISDRVVATDDQGLVSVAFAENFAATGHFYVDYSRRSDGAAVLSRFSVSTNSEVADSDSEEVLLVIPQPTAIHNHGQLAFGEDGYLYFGLGDGGSGDPNNFAQNPDSLLGKILRIEVNGAATGYKVPANNPYVNKAGYRPEIWALGLQYPWRFSFDRQTGDFYIGDVGANRVEEIDFQPASSRGGENYGWRIFEGTSAFNMPTNFDLSQLTAPLTTYTNANGPFGNSAFVVGGYVYRGPEFPRMVGIYFYGDFSSGRFWGLKFDGTNWQSREFAVPQHYIATFGEDDSGNLYFADYLTGSTYMVGDGSTVTSPSFGLRSGSYNTEQIATVTCDTPDAVIHYTLDGGDPSETAPTIDSGGTIPVNSRLTLKARAYRPDLNPSPTTSAQYFLYVGLSFDPAVGPITNRTQVKIKASTSGVTIRYTLDGTDPSDPASASAIYSGPLLLDGNTTLKAVGFKDGFDYSGIVSQFYGWGNYQNVAIWTIAGNGTAGYQDGGGTRAQFNYPQGICVDASGNVFVADTGNNMVRKISPRSEVTTFAGTGVAGFQDGPALTAMFSSPTSVSIDSSGNLYVADSGNHRIRRIDTNSMVITYAGTGASASDDGPRLNATFLSLTQTAINSRGDLYVGDWARLRKISVEGSVTTVAGPGSWCCGWSGYVGVGVDSTGNAYVGVSGGPVRLIDSMGVDLIFAGGVAGHADGPRLLAQFDSNFYINSFLPRYLGGDNLGNLFVCDRNWIRKIDTNGIVSTLANVSRLGTSAPPPFGFAMGVCGDNAGNVYVSDIVNHTIRKMSRDTDFDGIPDTEEGGMTPFVTGIDDQQIDSDRDGMSNAAEYIAGTDPTDIQSVLRLNASLDVGGHITISWTGVFGRIYRIQGSNNLENWVDLTAALQGTGTTMSVDDSASNARFYRLSIDLQ